MAGSDPDWFLRIVTVIGALVGVATLVLSRRDKSRERRAAEQADLPTIRMRWNTQIDDDGWYTLKVSFRDLKQAITFNKAALIRPRGAGPRGSGRKCWSNSHPRRRGQNDFA
jgi:hypothetical protein